MKNITDFVLAACIYFCIGSANALAQYDVHVTSTANPQTSLEDLKSVTLEKRYSKLHFILTVIASSATPDDERNYGVEDGRLRSRNFLAA